MQNSDGAYELLACCEADSGAIRDDTSTDRKLAGEPWVNWTARSPRVAAHLFGFETLAVQHIRQAAEFGLGIPLTPIGGESGKGRLNIEGISVDDATKIFRKTAYGEAF